MYVSIPTGDAAADAAEVSTIEGILEHARNELSHLSLGILR
ncbi:hypothetical protein [Haliangium ochraceum]|uniref:Uncharacterized protein n=1 Tax=Haliangium ochraceum (strain DSM 14365 / JCM 11303 / SMP-2) TaxID=502025 RepID=D0LLM7_HALO1|nr:hypothetical protein [Haliangium ochraceum]ACY13244.1 hypothetical protein Hoch_0607 [Haliangium ochraceum DSM 14365]